MNIEKAQHLPIIEVRHVEGEGEYVVIDGKQIARFDGPEAREDAARCCATLVEREIVKLGQQQPELPEHESYRKELVERARVKYPDATLEQSARIEKEINRRVEIVRTYQEHLLKVADENFPGATPEERQTLLTNIRQEVSAYRESLEKHLLQERERRQ
jgi:hypothetical protein